jgi:single-strand DNA-binding protein
MLSKVMLIGNVGRDPEIRQTNNGDIFARFSLATNKVVKGEKFTQWWDITVFDSKKAQLAQEYLTRGSKVYIEGELNVREYQGKDGTAKTAIEVVVGRFDGKMILMGERGDSKPSASSPFVADDPTNNSDDLDDVVPF